MGEMVSKFSGESLEKVTGEMNALAQRGETLRSLLAEMYFANMRNTDEVSDHRRGDSRYAGAVVQRRATG